MGKGKLKDCVGEEWQCDKQKEEKPKEKKKKGTLCQQKKITRSEICYHLCTKSHPNGGEKNLNS